MFLHQSFSFKSEFIDEIYLILTRSQDSQLNFVSAINNSDSVPMAISYPKLFTTEYLEAKVKDCQPHGSDFEKANSMFSAGTDYILNESVANNFARFSVQAQSENVEPYGVEIEKKHNLSRDKMSQLSSSCSCPHFQKRKIKYCKHIIYVILCKYVRP